MQFINDFGRLLGTGRGTVAYIKLSYTHGANVHMVGTNHQKTWKFQKTSNFIKGGGCQQVQMLNAA